MSNAFAILTLVVGLIGLGVILWAMRSGNADRQAEDHAREFYDRHGRWPDQTPEEAEAERARVRAVAPAALSEPDEQGRV